jgi:probable selenium-dependent hydroxylase accessory protein YqeC
MNLEIKEYSTFESAFSITGGEIISLVGAGGKTTLMFALARELSAPGKLVITTTTTKIFEPSASLTEQLIIEEDEYKLIGLLNHIPGKYQHVTLAKSRLFPNKLIGISPEFVALLKSLESVSHIIIEADGASQRPLKAPNETEPVIPEKTTLVIPVVGIDALGRPLNGDVVFRAEIAARLLDMPLGQIITPKIIARLLTHEKGIIKGTPANARVVPFINKVDSKADLEKASGIAREILAAGHPKIDKVVIGQANKSGVCFVVS